MSESPINATKACNKSVFSVLGEESFEFHVKNSLFSMK